MITVVVESWSQSEETEVILIVVGVLDPVGGGVGAKAKEFIITTLASSSLASSNLFVGKPSYQQKQKQAISKKK